MPANSRWDLIHPFKGLINKYEPSVELWWERKAEVLGVKPVPAPRFPPKIPHKIAWHCSRASAARSR